MTVNLNIKPGIEARLVARARAIRRLYERHLPQLAVLFREYLRLPAPARQEFLARRYADLPRSDFSRDLLTPARGLTVSAWPASMHWSDLGTPERLERWADGWTMPRAPAHEHGVGPLPANAPLDWQTAS